MASSDVRKAQRIWENMPYVRVLTSGDSVKEKARAKWDHTGSEQIVRVARGAGITKPSSSS